MLQPIIMGAVGLSLATSPADAGSVRQSKNGEFIFSQYPPGALTRGEQGTVRFRVETDPDGHVLGCEVTGSSGHSQLDDETCEMIVGHATFAPAVDSGGKHRAAVHDGMVNWRIPGLATGSSAKVASAKSLPDKLICKRINETGSLVKHSKLCLTSREWTRYSEQNQTDWGDLQGRQGFGICPVDPATGERLC